MEDLKLLNIGAFSELSQNEQIEVEGGLFWEAFAGVCGAVALIITVAQGIYQLGEAHGKRDGYRARYGN